MPRIAPNWRTGMTALVIERPVADGAGDRRPGDRRGDGGQGRAGGPARVGLAAAVVAEVDRQVAGRRHRQDDDLGHQRAARERQLDVEAAPGPPRSPARSPSRRASARSPTRGSARPRASPRRSGSCRRPPGAGRRSRSPRSRRPGAPAGRRPPAGRAGAAPRTRRPRPRRAATVSITLCSFVFRSRTTTAVVVPLESISVPEEQRMLRQPVLERRQGRRVGRRGPDRPADRHRVGLQVDVLDRPLRRAQGQVAGERRQAVQRQQGVVDRPEQRHRVQRLDPLHARDPLRARRPRPAPTTRSIPAGVSSSGSS